MFDNIGTKVKIIAKVECWIGIVGSIIYAIVCFSKAGNLRGDAEDAMNALAWGMLILGPLFSWIGSWALYAIGEAADRSDDAAISAERINNRVKDLENQIDILLNQNQVKNDKAINTAAAPRPNEPIAAPRPQHEWICGSCGARIHENPCPICHNDIDAVADTAPYHCGVCGKAGPFAGPSCPDCHSSVRVYKKK